MVVGIGNDIVDVRRIEKLLHKSYGEKFLERVFTNAERSLCLERALPAPGLAARWAVKEAFYKALPPHLQPHSVWTSIELLHDKQGHPKLTVCDKGLSKRLNEAGIHSIFHTVSHEKEYATAFVLLESK